MNHASLACVSHDDAINLLRNAGPVVTLKVKHYRSAAPFLLKNLRQLIPEQEQNGTGKKYLLCSMFNIQRDD